MENKLYSFFESVSCMENVYINAYINAYKCIQMAEENLYFIVFGFVLMCAISCAQMHFIYIGVYNIIYCLLLLLLLLLLFG